MDALPMCPQEPKVIAFDAGGTLIDLDIVRIAGELEEHGCSVDPNELRHAIYAAKPIDAKDRPGPDAEGEFMVRRYMGTVLQILDQRNAIEAGIPHDAVSARMAQWLTDPEVSRSIWSIVPQGVVEALEHLRSRYRLIVISNSDGHVSKRLADVALADYFEAIYDSKLVGFSKPDPTIFQVALTDCGVAPEEMIYVGDFYDIDVIGAARAGVHCVLLDPVGAWGEVECAKAVNVRGFGQGL